MVRESRLVGFLVGRLNDWLDDPLLCRFLHDSHTKIPLLELKVDTTKKRNNNNNSLAVHDEDAKYKNKGME